MTASALADLAALLADRTRATCCLALIDGRSWTATESAQLVEDLSAHAAPALPTGSLRKVRASAALTEARTCYDHFAGRFGVALYAALDERGFLAPAELTDLGWQWMTGLGIEVPRGKRPVVRSCLDWTERRPHLAGAAGAAFCGHALQSGWVQRGSGRAVRVTPYGLRALEAAGIPRREAQLSG